MAANHRRAKPTFQSSIITPKSSTSQTGLKTKPVLGNPRFKTPELSLMYKYKELDVLLAKK
jgi:hypothetical protein